VFTLYLGFTAKPPNRAIRLHPDTKVNIKIINRRNYWVFWTFPSSGILQTRKHDVSETGSVSVLRLRGGREATYSVGPLRKG
jgi:hypothetical protein